MSNERVTLAACRAIAKHDGSACLLHALLTTRWPDYRLMIRNAQVWVDVSEHLWLAYAELAYYETISLFVTDLLVMLNENDHDWRVVRPTQKCLDQLGLADKSWFSN